MTPKPSPASDDPPPPSSSPSPQPSPAVNNTTSADEVENDPGEVIRISANLVPIPASVIDSQGRVITNLELKDFELRVDGHPKPISDISRAETPVRMAVLFDNSKSLTFARELEKRAAIKFFRTVMRSVDQAAIYSVSTDVRLEQPLTSDVTRLVRTIERFGEPEGATALFDAIVQAAAYLKPQQGRKVIVIVSDGADTTSSYNFAETLQRVLAADCQVYAVQTGISENANLRDLAAERRLQEFAAQTGGAVYVPKALSDLNTAFAQIAADLAQQYILSYYPSDERRDGLFRPISVRVTTRPNARVRTRKGYYPPKG